jgi:UDP-2,4-diacetamido-2,4,6-trideoxy-beta-L-altropyranose hydrolase
MSGETLIIRADADLQMGTGHVMRCLAIAQAWMADGGNITFAMTTTAKPLEVQVTARGAGVTYLSAQPASADDAAATIALARRYEATWVVVDGYHFDASYQRRLKDANLKVLVVDDYGHAGHYTADVILNHNGAAHEELYPGRSPDSRLLLGPRYLLLRQEFARKRLPSRETLPIACRLLVTLGGSDADNVTGKVLQALASIDSELLELVIVVGANNQYSKRLRDLTQTLRQQLTVVQQVTNMAPLMNWADFAIAAAGTTAWELAYMAVPTLLIPLAENQRAVAATLDRAGVALNLGWHASLTPGSITQAAETLMVASERRRQMSECGRNLVDGHGADRVVARLKNDALWLRTVQAEDCRLLWEWANDPYVRAVSFASDAIAWESHQAWFRARLKDPHCVFYLALDHEDTPQAQVRYDCEGDQAMVSISVDQRGRGKGHGTIALRQSSHRLFVSTPVTTIHAYIKTSNVASIRAFEKAGYQQTVDTTVTSGVSHLTLQRQRAGVTQEVTCRTAAAS